jgi:hypothetical protein
VEQSIARRSVEAVGRIALDTPDADGIVDRLLQFLELGQAHVTAETLVQVCVDPNRPRWYSMERARELSSREIDRHLSRVAAFGSATLFARPGVAAAQLARHLRLGDAHRPSRSYPGVC